MKRVKLVIQEKSTSNLIQNNLAEIFLYIFKIFNCKIICITNIRKFIIFLKNIQILITIP